MSEDPPTAPAVEASALTVQLGERTVLEQVTFAIPTAAVLAVVGPNGSGKTTLLKALLGLVKPASGRVLVLGTSPERLQPGSIGYVPQIKTLDRTFPGTSIDLVVSGLRRRWPWRIGDSERTRALAALRLVGAEQLADQPIAELSGGELQRVYLSRAAARDPRLIMLDEPATGIDMVGEETIYRFIDACHRSGTATVVIVTHDLSVAFHHATHVLLLNRRAIGFGPPRVVLSEDSLGRAYGHAEHRPAGRLGAGPYD